MKHKRMLAIIAAALFLFSGRALNAQTAATQAPQDAGKVDRQALKLTAEQKAQLNSIRKSEREQLMTLRNDQTLSREQQGTKVRAIRQASRQQILGILTPQQQQAFRGSRGERRERGFREGRGQGREGGPSTLTDTQRNQLKSIHQTTRDQVNAIRNDAILTQEQKLARLKSLRQGTEQQVSTILTPEQREQMRQERRGGPGRFGGRRLRGGPMGPNAPGVTPPAKP
jgi:Spy/CpxP family protein refolding chaperone